jgi:hypothetical protein
MRFMVVFILDTKQYRGWGTRLETIIPLPQVYRYNFRLISLITNTSIKIGVRCLHSFPESFEFH